MAAARFEREQLQPVAEVDAVRLGEDDVGRHAPLRGEPAQRLGADAGAGGEVDDRLQRDDRAAVGDQRREPVLDLVRRSCERSSGSMITAAAEARTSIRDLSRLPSSLSEVRPNAQKVP